MVSVLTSSVLDHGLKPKTIKIDICCFSTKHAALRCKNNDWLALNQDNVYEKIYMFTDVMQYQRLGTIKVQSRLFVWYKGDIIIIIECNLFSP